MKRWIWAVLPLAVATTGCVNLNKRVEVAMERPIYIPAAFDEAEAYSKLLPGANTIRGNAFMRQKGGGVVTCAGATVYLFPAVAYTVERMGHMYGFGADAGVMVKRKQFDPDPPAYYQKVRTTKCDAQGNFVFDQVSDGDFFITTVVAWSVGYSQQGGGLMQRARVSGGKVVSFVLSS